MTSRSDPLAGVEVRFDDVLARNGLGALRRARVRTLQVNVTKRCNLACHHCHVESGPKRTEAISRQVAERVVELLAANPEVECLDLTGGAPELNPHFRFLVREARALGRRVIDRCNLTVLFEPGQEDTARFLADQGVDVVASLPCYTADNVDAQRGKGVFPASIEGLRALNALGYAAPGTGLRLDLVYNPLGPSLPPDAAELEDRYRAELGELFGIRFDRLIAIANMPIKRFAHALVRDGQLSAYLSLLVNHFNPATVERVMCRELVSVGHDGRLWDCDFNQMLELDPPLPARTIFDLTDLGELDGAPVATAPHCFGCTAGVDSSCGGALTAAD